MTEPTQDIRVTGELRHLADQEREWWEVSAYGGPIDGPFEVRVTADDEEGAKTAFRSAWNQRAGTTWSDGQFGWDYNYGR